jgi:transcriptional regulator with XRE-family HTH domain
VEEILRRLGQRIREVRLQRGFKSQEEFADYCRLHRTFVGHLETGRKDFRLTTIIRVAELLGVTLEELFAGLEAGRPFAGKRLRTSVDGVARELIAMEVSLQRLKKMVSPRQGVEQSKGESGTEPRRKGTKSRKRRG